MVAINGRPILHMAHVSDLLRLQALRDFGGIYMDMDVITVRPFAPLMMNHEFVMGQEGPNGVYGLCNAVMLSAPNSSFVRLWIDHYAEVCACHVIETDRERKGGQGMEREGGREGGRLGEAYKDRETHA